MPKSISSISMFGCNLVFSLQMKVPFHLKKKQSKEIRANIQLCMLSELVACRLTLLLKLELYVAKR